MGNGNVPFSYVMKLPHINISKAMKNETISKETLIGLLSEDETSKPQDSHEPNNEVINNQTFKQNN